MNGLDFDHRVRRPWARDPAFYVTIYAAQSDVPAHEGSVIHGWIDVWTYDFPLSAEDAAEIADRIGTIPALLDQARTNLTGDARDLWMAGFRSFQGQRRDLDALAERVAGTAARLDATIVAAGEATDAFHDWLEEEVPSKTGPSGVGKDNYTWYMQNVHLVPYSWEEQVTLMRRELARAHSSLRLEENRNRHLPELERIDSPEEYDRQLNASVTAYMRFLEEEEIHAIEEWMDPQLLQRSDIPRSARDANAHASLDRARPKAGRPPPEPDPSGPVPVQHLGCALGGPRDRGGGDDDAGGPLR